MFEFPVSSGYLLDLKFEFSNEWRVACVLRACVFIVSEWCHNTRGFVKRYHTVVSSFLFCLPLYQSVQKRKEKRREKRAKKKGGKKRKKESGKRGRVRKGWKFRKTCVRRASRRSKPRRWISPAPGRWRRRCHGSVRAGGCRGLPTRSHQRCPFRAATEKLEQEVIPLYTDWSSCKSDTRAMQGLGVLVLIWFICWKYHEG